MFFRWVEHLSWGKLSYSNSHDHYRNSPQETWKKVKKSEKFHDTDFDFPYIFTTLQLLFITISMSNTTILMTFTTISLPFTTISRSLTTIYFHSLDFFSWKETPQALTLFWLQMTFQKHIRGGVSTTSLTLTYYYTHPPYNIM